MEIIEHSHFIVSDRYHKRKLRHADTYCSKSVQFHVIGEILGNAINPRNEKKLLVIEILGPS